MSDENNSSDKDGAFQRLLDRHKNDGLAMAEKLFGENFAYRTQIRQLEQQVLQAEGKLPGEGSVVLTGNDAQSWAAYQALGKPDELKQGLEEKTQLQGKLQGMERETTLRTVAETVGYKAGVLANLDRMAKAEGKALAFDVRDTTVDGKTVKAAFVKDGNKELPLTEYAATNWADFMPSLTVQGTQQQQASGIRYPAQHAGNGAGGKSDPVADFIQQQEQARAAVKNPLLKE